LLGALAAAWLIAVRGAPAPAGTAEPAGEEQTLRTLLAHPERCADVVAPMPTVQCVIDGVDVDVRLLGADAGAAYAREVSVPLRDHAGPAQCADGHSEERSWSRPTRPSDVTGRYQCRLEHGRAAMWWTDEQGLLWHAVARDGDVAALFDWWRSHPSE
jgi:hypothetical protein